MKAKESVITIDELRMRLEDVLEQTNWVCGHTSEMTVTQIIGFLDRLPETIGSIVWDFDYIGLAVRPAPKISAANFCRRYGIKVEPQALIALQDEAAHLSSEEGSSMGFQLHAESAPGGITFDRTILYRAALRISLFERGKTITQGIVDDTSR